MTNIFEYLDYRAYLRDVHAEIKKIKPYFSFRFISARVGLNPGYIVKVFHGTVHLGATNIPAFIDLLGLCGKEADYFTELVHFGRAKDDGEVERRFERLQAIKGIRFVTVADRAVDFFRDWYNMAVRSLISIYPFDGRQFRALGAMLTPPITAQQARRSIALLERLGLIERNESGIYRVTGQFISTGEKWLSPVIRDYQKKTMQLAVESLERHHKDLRDISTVTMTFSTRQLPALRERIRAFRQELLLMSQDLKDEDCVMQFNVQFFPAAVVDREGA